MVHVVRGDPAVVGVVADRAERGPEMFAVGGQQVLPIPVGADAEPQVDGPRAAGRDRRGDEVDQPPLGDFSRWSASQLP